MTTPALINGSYADLKTVKTRSVVQIIIEVPIEQGAEIVKLFGFPQPGKEVPVSVVRFNPASIVPEKPAETKGSDTPGPVKPRPPASTRYEQKNRMCGVASFQDFIARETKALPFSPAVIKKARYEATDTRVKGLMNMESGSELDTNPEKGRQWDQLVTSWEAADGRLPEVRG